MIKVIKKENKEGMINIIANDLYKFKVIKNGKISKNAHETFLRQYKAPLKLFFDGEEFFIKDILLKNITLGSFIPMKTLNFESGVYDIPTTSFPELERLLKVLRKNPSVKISRIIKLLYSQ